MNYLRNPQTIRKALAAFIVPLLALPVGEWIVGGGFDRDSLFAALATGVAAAVAVFLTPNQPAA